MLGYVRSDFVWLGKFLSGYNMLGQVMSG